jgi:hypothetical protein
MNSECESHYRARGRNGRAVKGNCVVARRGGEQPETEGWSRTKVNSIRYLQRASLLAKGEACRVSGESVTVQGLPILETDRGGYGWSGNDQKGTWAKWRERPGSRREGPVAGRAFIVAMKPGNSGGAKGRRKMKTSETVPEQNLIDCCEANTRKRIAIRAGNGRLEAILGTGCLRKQGHVGPIFFYGLGPNMRSTSPFTGIIDWRAGCGRPACPVRREGRSS